MERKLVLPVLCLIVAWLLPACGSTATPTATASVPGPTLTPSILPPATAAFTPTPTAIPSNTPTRTPTQTEPPPPTATPSPSPEPTPVNITDPEIIDWDETTSIPSPSSAPFDLNRGQQLVFANGFVYIFGGWAGGDNHLRNVYYSQIGAGGALGAWRATTSLPPGPYYDHVAVKVGGFVYLLTGSNGQDQVHFAPLQPDGTIGNWTSTARLSPSRQNFAAASYGNFIYATGGNSSGNRDFVQFASVRPDGGLNAWTLTTPLPQALQAHTMLAYGGYLYVFGGQGANDQRLNTVYYAPINANGSVGDWLTTSPMPNKASGFSTFESNGYIYLLGGNVGGVYFAHIQDDHSLDGWTKATSLPASNLHGLRTGAYNGIAYAMGGFTLTTFKNTVYFGAIGTGTAAPTLTPTASLAPPTLSPTAAPPTQTPSGAACGLTIGDAVQAAAGANLWSEPDVVTGSLLGPLAEGSTVYILAGPVWGRIVASGAAGWWWEVGGTAGGTSLGWVWEGRFTECD